MCKFCSSGHYLAPLSLFDVFECVVAREVKEVSEESDDAKRWPRWQPPDQGEGDKSIDHPTSIKQQDASKLPESSHPPPRSSSAIAPRPPAKRLGPRKPKTKLEPLPSAQKAKKLTTLGKSAMDWRSHVQQEGPSGLKDELEANRRGGGYLEKVEFLQRVEERKAGALDATTSKRRRG